MKKYSPQQLGEMADEHDSMAKSLRTTANVLREIGNSVAVIESITPTWINVTHQAPPIDCFGEKPYVLAVDAKGRMSIGYASTHSTGFIWVFAKQIGPPTHWMPLPPPPTP